MTSLEELEAGYQASLGDVSTSLPSAMDLEAGYQQSIPSTTDILKNEILAVGNKAVEGGADLFSGIEAINRNINPFYPGGPRLFGINENVLNAGNRDVGQDVKDVAEKLYLFGPEKPQTLPGRITGQIAYNAPGMLIPGGTAASRAKAVIGAGLASGAAREITDNPYVDAVATLIGGATPELARLGVNTLKSATPTGKAANVLERAGGQAIDDIIIDTSDPFWNTRTLAEETQSPRLASLEQEVLKRSEDAGLTDARNNLLVRQNKQKTQLLDPISSQRTLSEEVGGEALRGMVAAEAEKVLGESGTAAKAFGAVNDEALIATEGLSDEISNILKTEYKAGGAPSKLTSIADEVSRATTSKEGSVPKTFSYMQDLRDRANSVWAELKAAPGKEKDARIANDIKQTIDQFIDNPKNMEIPGGMSKADVDTYRLGNKLYSEGKETFQKGSLGAAIQKDLKGNYSYKASAAVEKLFDNTPEGTRQLLKALPDDAASIDKARGIIRDKIVRDSLDNDGNLTAHKFRTYLRQNKEALTADYNGKRLFDDDHIKTLERVADDLGLTSTTSNNSVKNLALGASKGQPTTAQSLIKEYSGRLLGEDIPLIRSGVKAYKGAVDRVLTKAIFDKQFAKELVGKSTVGSVKRALNSFERNALIAESQSEGKERELLDSSLNLPKPSNQMPRGMLSASSNTTQPEEAPNDIDTAIKSAVDRILNVPDAKGEAMAIQRTNQVTPELKAAVIRQESNGKADAVSSKGAQGVMQLMPATGKEMLQKLKKRGEIPQNIEYDPFNPTLNVMLGTAYLNEQLQNYGGDVKLALAAYNAGPGFLSRLLTKHSTMDFDKIEKYLPAETRDYVAKITKNLMEV